jgi:threonyl-tRNA synthetase
MKRDLHTLRHSASHVLAQAVLELFPETKLAIGPSIDTGFYYDFDTKKPFTPEDLEKIEKRALEIIKKDLKIKNVLKTRAEAKKILKDNSYKIELLNDIEDKKISFFQQGDFMDLCKGPHVSSTGEIKAFKLLTLAGAYWRGDAKNKMLQRIYGTAFYEKKDLKKFLHVLEEAKKRDHRKLGEQLDLFSFHEEGPGFPFFHPKGMIVINELLAYWRQVHNKYDYKEVKTPMMLNKSLWLKSGHWDNYKENMYFTKIDNKENAVKPMNCPGGILIYKSKIHSYKEFPLKVGELGLVHRHELSGVLNGLFRVRAFTQDDAHIYCTEKQAEKEVVNVIKLAEEMYKTFGLTYELELSTKPEKYIGSDEDWEMAEKALENALKKVKLKYKLNPGDGAFYGPKIDVHVKDSLGRTWQCATIQLDFAMPEKFDLTYDEKDGKKHRPVMIHRTIYGSLERFLGILIEHYAGKFPLWLSPVQVKILSLTDRSVKFAENLKDTLEKNNIRTEIDTRSESMSKKVRDAQNEKVNYMVTVGDKEVEANKLAIRTREGKVSFGVSIDKFIKDLLKEVQDRR